ncbi:uncharacterized protein LOC116253608 [Nymphaea colorata]|nr:uncharacterized protein LOC116253608 [Nymphaea colorata]
MGKRRFAQVATSDEEDEANPASTVTRRSPQPASASSSKKKKPGKVEEAAGEPEIQEEEETPVDLKPVGDPVKVSGKGRDRKTHYSAFELEGNVFQIEDPVLLTPEAANEKPYVAIIKDITQAKDGSMAVLGQWFYRPEEADKKGGGSWQACDTRELFYSFHRDEVPAEAVMHKCVVHFIPLGKQLPVRSVHPGFIVQKVYDTVEKKLWKLTDKDYEDSKQHEIDLLVQKTRERLGELPDLEVEEGSVDQDDHTTARRNLRRKQMPSISVARDDDAARSDQFTKIETPGSCTNEASEYYIILSNFKALTGDSYRDKSLEKLLQAIYSVRDTIEQIDNPAKVGAVSNQNVGVSAKTADSSNGSQERNQKGEETVRWPDAAVSAVTALEKASHEGLGSDLQKYNQKMRQLVFNFKNNALLARRLLDKELEPSVILNMSPSELKEGITAEEKSAKEPQELEEPVQMTDVRCKRCMEKKVRVSDIITVGHGDRYQLECLQCGNTWYTTRDAISTLTQETPNLAVSVGTAPWATAKFEDVEKKLVSPRESEKPSPDIFQKSKSAVLETQKSMNSRPRAGDSSGLPGKA